MWRKTAICSRDELQESEDLCLTDGNAASKYAGWLLKASCAAQAKGCSACFVPPTLKYYSCKSKVCAKTIVIVKDCCLVAGGLCRSMAGRGLVSGSRRTKFRRVDGSGTPAEPPGNHNVSRQRPSKHKKCKSTGEHYRHKYKKDRKESGP